MYQQYFGFSSEPFAADLPPEKLFRFGSFIELQKRFEHLCTYRGIMVLTGHPGSGKTTALRYLIAGLNQKTHLPVYLPLSTVSVFEFYRQFNKVLGGEEYYYKSDIYRSIQDQIITWSVTKGMLPVIVFDEAHLLKDQNFRELQIILNFKMDSIMPLALILSGQPVLSRRLQSCSLDSFNQRVLLKYALGPLSEDETIQYIKHGLELTGRQDSVITAAACKVVYQKSKGVPRRIGSLVKTALLYCASVKSKIVDADEVLISSREVLS